MFIIPETLDFHIKLTKRQLSVFIDIFRAWICFFFLASLDLLSLWILIVEETEGADPGEIWVYLIGVFFSITCFRLFWWRAKAVLIAGMLYLAVLISLRDAMFSTQASSLKIA